MNKNLLIALVIGAAALIAFFILSGPAEKPITPAPGTGGTGGSTGLTPDQLLSGIPGGSGTNPLSQLLSGITTGGTSPNAALGPLMAGRLYLPTFGYVKIYTNPSDFSDVAYYLIESNGENVAKGTEKFNAIRAEVIAHGKIKV